jgi:hypothetical protein
MDYYKKYLKYKQKYLILTGGELSDEITRLFDDIDTAIDAIRTRKKPNSDNEIEQIRTLIHNLNTAQLVLPGKTETPLIKSYIDIRPEFVTSRQTMVEDLANDKLDSEFTSSDLFLLETLEPEFYNAHLKDKSPVGQLNILQPNKVGAELGKLGSHRLILKKVNPYFFSLAPSEQQTILTKIPPGSLGRTIRIIKDHIKNGVEFRKFSKEQTDKYIVKIPHIERNLPAYPRVEEYMNKLTDLFRLYPQLKEYGNDLEVIHRHNKYLLFPHIKTYTDPSVLANYEKWLANPNNNFQIIIDDLIKLYRKLFVSTVAHIVPDVPKMPDVPIWRTCEDKKSGIIININIEQWQKIKGLNLNTPDSFMEEYCEDYCENLLESYAMYGKQTGIKKLHELHELSRIQNWSLEYKNRQLTDIKCNPAQVIVFVRAYQIGMYNRLYDILVIIYDVIKIIRKIRKPDQDRDQNFDPNSPEIIAFRTLFKLSIENSDTKDKLKAHIADVSHIEAIMAEFKQQLEFNNPGAQLSRQPNPSPSRQPDPSPSLPNNLFEYCQTVKAQYDEENRRKIATVNELLKSEQDPKKTANLRQQLAILETAEYENRDLAEAILSYYPHYLFNKHFFTNIRRLKRDLDDLLANQDIQINPLFDGNLLNTYMTKRYNVNFVGTTAPEYAANDMSSDAILTRKVTEQIKDISLFATDYIDNKDNKDIIQRLVADFFEKNGTAEADFDTHDPILTVATFDINKILLLSRRIFPEVECLRPYQEQLSLKTAWFSKRTSPRYRDNLAYPTYNVSCKKSQVLSKLYKTGESIYKFIHSIPAEQELDKSAFMTVYGSRNDTSAESHCSKFLTSPLLEGTMLWKIYDYTIWTSELNAFLTYAHLNTRLLVYHQGTIAEFPKHHSIENNEENNEKKAIRFNEQLIYGGTLLIPEAYNKYYMLYIFWDCEDKGFHLYNPNLTFIEPPSLTTSYINVTYSELLQINGLGYKFYYLTKTPDFVDSDKYFFILDKNIDPASIKEKLGISLIEKELYTGTNGKFMWKDTPDPLYGIPYNLNNLKLAKSANIGKPVSALASVTTQLSRFSRQLAFEPSAQSNLPYWNRQTRIGV